MSVEINGTIYAGEKEPFPGLGPVVQSRMIPLFYWWCGAFCLCVSFGVFFGPRQ